MPKMNKLIFKITDEVAKLGVRILTLSLSNLKNSKTNPEFEEYLKQELINIGNFWQGKNYKDDLVLRGFRDLHTKVGVSNKKSPASPEVLLGLFLQTGRFPKINTLVDIYNLISIKTRLALGAHDSDKIHGNVTLRLTEGSETFIPLGKTQSVPVTKEEYSYIDDSANIICRLEVLQVEPTKVTLDTKNVFLIVQGNLNTDNSYIESAAKEVADLITKFCGGKYRYLNKLK